MKKQFTSRLARKEYKQNLRRIYLYGLMIILIIAGLLIFGIPALIKIALLLGNLKSSYLPVEQVNQIPPPAPRFKPTFEATNSAQIALEGYSDPETVVEIFQNETAKIKTTSDREGFFLVSDFSLASGINEIYAKATDKNNTPSLPSEKLIINFDDIPPNITLTEPAENASIFKPDGKIQIKGEITEEASVTINDRLVILDSFNKFTCPVTLKEGANSFLIIATDPAGNRMEKEFTITRE